MESLRWILSTVSTSFILISAVLMALGWRAIRKGNERAHRKLMVTASICAFFFFVIYMFRTVFIGNYVFGGPDEVRPFYLIFLLVHIVLATAGGVLGGLSLYLGYKKRFALHKRLGPWTSVVWFFTAFTGVVTYFLLHVIYPSDEVSGLIHAIFGNSR